VIRSAGSPSVPGTGLARAVCTRALLATLLLLGVGALANAERARAQAGGPVSSVLSVEDTEALVRRVDYEGMPEDEAARIGADGTARLIEMLADPDEAPHHARILLALGISGGEGAFEAIHAWTVQGLADGELDRAGFRAWQALPFALGKLARRDPRALARLAAVFDAEAPDWSFRHFSGARLQALERRAAVAALAEAGTPEALRVLDEVERSTADPDLVDHVRSARAEASARSTESPR
jgi:hypothetical protein